MISFENIETTYSLGNNLFQYAFIRSLSEKLKTNFYFPSWPGDGIFDLNEEKERINKSKKIIRKYSEPEDDLSVKKDILKIENNTLIWGYFQSEEFFDKQKVKKWFIFKEPQLKRVKNKYQSLDFSKSVGMHLRFSDQKNSPAYYVPHQRYYLEALSKVKHKKNILVFSDEIKLAKKHLKELKGNFIYIEDNGAHEDLYLMSQCKDFICSASTLSWWGAWLNKHKDKIIICPREGALRPGHKKFKRNYYWPKEWIKIKALRKGILDDYFLKSFKCLVLNFPSKTIRGIRLILGKKNKPVWDKYIKRN